MLNRFRFVAIVAAVLVAALVFQASAAAPVAFAQAGGKGEAETVHPTDAGHDTHAPAEGGGKPNPLAFDPDLAVFTFIVFLLLFAVLAKFAWPQISAALLERENKIAAQLAAAEAKHEEAKRLLAEHEAKLAATAGEVRGLLEEARRDAEVTKSRIVAEARQAGEEEKARALREIERAKDGAIQELAAASANVAIDLARRVVEKHITPEEHASIVREALGKLAAANPSKNELMALEDRVTAKHDTVMDVTEEQIARVYAKAFLAAANKSPDAASLVDEIESLVDDVLAKFPALAEMLRSSLVSAEHKEEAVDRIFQSRASTTLLNFLKVVARHGRLQLLRPIARAVRKLYTEQLGQSEVQIRVAAPLDDGLREEILSMARKALKTEPVLQVSVDTSLIAGIVVRIGDRVFDGSVLNRMNQLRKTVVSRVVEYIETRPEKFIK